MDDRLVLFGLHEMEGIGWDTIKHIVNRPHGIQTLFGASRQDLESIQVRTDRADFIVRQLTPSWIESRMEQYDRKGIGFVTIWDEEYPPLLRETPAPPWVLYYRGDIGLSQRQPLIAMVGTRVPTAYGKNVALSFASDLVKAGVVVVSGMARGIDTRCHEGALSAEGKTIAVLGSGIDVVYPRENRSLYEQICRDGLVLSEYPLQTEARPGLFPRRNRIIAGLTLGTVVVEADKDSGSLITAGYAVNMNRDVFAIPGPIRSPKSRGTLNLLKDGEAKLTTTVEDILEEYESWFGLRRHTYNIESSASQQRTPEEDEIYRLIAEKPVTFNELLAKSKCEFGHLHSVLLSLTIKKQIEQLPGSTYIII